MKVILWGSVALLALLWTSGAALLAKAVKWSAQQMSGGTITSLDGMATNLVIPVWLTPWFDPAMWTGFIQMMQDILENFSSVLPSMGMVLGWLVPAIWITWVLGILVLVGAVIVGTLMLQRYHKS